MLLDLGHPITPDMSLFPGTPQPERVPLAAVEIDGWRETELFFPLPWPDADGGPARAAARVEEKNAPSPREGAETIRPVILSSRAGQSKTAQAPALSPGSPSGCSPPSKAPEEG